METKNLSASNGVIFYDATKTDGKLFRQSEKNGYYLLKNGSCSSITVYGQEKGIFIDEDLYIPLKFSCEKVTFHEAQIYYDLMQEKMPDLYKIIRLQQGCARINNSLERIGLKDNLLSNNILQDYWYEEAHKPGKEEKRYCIIISETENYVRPQYELIDSDRLLFENSLLCRKCEKVYAPESLTLIVNILGVDILSGAGVVFYRGADLKLMPLSGWIHERNYIEVYGQDLVQVNGILYQVYKGKLEKIHCLSDKYYHLCLNEDSSQIEIYEEYDNQERDMPLCRETMVYKKNQDGLYEYYQIRHHQ